LLGRASAWLSSLKFNPGDCTELAEEQEEVVPTPVDVASPLIDRATAVQAGGLGRLASRRGALQG
jgi:hypothetical protein